MAEDDGTFAGRLARELEGETDEGAIRIAVVRLLAEVRQIKLILFWVLVVVPATAGLIALAVWVARW
ncbi:MAG TPA: hypothetical protein VHX38_21705 [Pseudonocardiaceae bacterium]|jgi:hypothetical protein|nr:hypothetical protein [Pseudonocardiaceae bacterium]